MVSLRPAGCLGASRRRGKSGEVKREAVRPVLPGPGRAGPAGAVRAAAPPRAGAAAAPGQRSRRWVPRVSGGCRPARRAEGSWGGLARVAAPPRSRRFSSHPLPRGSWRAVPQPAAPARLRGADVLRVKRRRKAAAVGCARGNRWVEAALGAAGAAGWRPGDQHLQDRLCTFAPCRCKRGVCGSGI